MQMMDAEGKIWNPSRRGGGRVDIELQYISGILNANDLCPFIASGAVLPTDQDVLVFNNSQTRC